MQQVMEMHDKRMTTTMQKGERCLPALGVACLLGALMGSLCCSRMEVLQQLVQGQLEAQYTVWQYFVRDSILLMVMFFTGFLRIGCAISLLTAAVKGFCLSAVATLGVLELGNGGYVLSLVVWLLPGWLSIAALLLLGRQAMGWAAARSRFPAGRGKPLLPDGTYYITTIVCVAMILLAAILAVQVTPGLWAAVKSFLPIA